MQVFQESLVKIRRFLRDPDALVWSDSDILTYFNDAQKEIAEKTGYLQTVEGLHWPPEWDISYIYDWEWKNITSDLPYLALQEDTWRGLNYCYDWEAYYNAASLETTDAGIRFVHPWECYYVSGTAGVIPVPLPEDFNDASWISYDQYVLEPISEAELAAQDQFYRTRVGTPTHYYIPSKLENALVIYPQITAGD